MGDIGKPERIVEDEPISWPDEEPLTVPAPGQPTPETEPAAMGTAGAGTAVAGTAVAARPGAGARPG